MRRFAAVHPRCSLRFSELCMTSTPGMTKTEQRRPEIYIVRVGHKCRAGRYLKVGRRPTKEEYHRLEELSMRGETVMGVPVSTDSRLYGVCVRTSRGEKLLSKHCTLADASDWIDANGLGLAQ